MEPTEFVRDSAFPFEPLEELVARIDGKRIVIEKQYSSNLSASVTFRLQ